MGSMEVLAKPAKTRSVHTFTVPAHLSDGTIASVSLVELSAEEELQAARRAGGDPVRLALELPKQSLVRVNGTPINLVDGSADKVWANMPPKVRQLVMVAHGDIHTPKEEDVGAFLGSRSVEV